MKFSVIIPTLNESDGIQDAITSLREPGDVEIIVADGGSTDGTAEVAETCADRVVRSARGRGRQMNAGARVSQGEGLVFLHADSRMPRGWKTALEEAFRDKGVVGGSYSLAIASRKTSLKWIARFANWRTRMTRVPYGDQGIFVRRAVFEELGGYPEIPIMEDVAFGRKMKRAGLVRFIPLPVSTSARRWEAEGVIPATLRNWTLVTLFLLGVGPDRLARWYPAVVSNGTDEDERIKDAG